MDNQSYSAYGSGLLGSYGASDPSLNVPVTAGSSTFSPYLNIDPRFINQGSEFILPEGQKQQRGRFELAFSQIGSSVMLGALYGGLNGIRVGRTATAELTGKVKMSHIFGFTFEKIRGTEDEANTVGAGTLTGILYGSADNLVTTALGSHKLDPIAHHFLPPDDLRLFLRMKSYIINTIESFLVK
uniref:Mitochondrial import inner membrane translocase subunit Tim23-like n=1 Tax=Saccoglossus kowalevskii TaxID=10224 RepID=A0ABM0M3E7_SACKO|nr:PREDICTED: mitochondrial import inner membrane translocase subunit Tim23-like [Saccoglossus kowalevskii]